MRESRLRESRLQNSLWPREVNSRNPGPAPSRICAHYTFPAPAPVLRYQYRLFCADAPMSHAHRASYGSISDTYRSGIPPSGVIGGHYIGVGGGGGASGSSYTGAGSGGSSGGPYHSAGSGHSERVRASVPLRERLT